MDLVADLLRNVRACSGVFIRAECTSPWALESPDAELLASVLGPEASHAVFVCVLTGGQCLVTHAGLPPARMETGDAIILAGAEPFLVCDDRGARPVSMLSLFSHGAADALSQVTLGGGGRASQLICGCVGCDQRFDLLVDAVPAMLLVRRRSGDAFVEAIDTGDLQPVHVSRGSAALLRATLDFAVEEADAARPGTVTTLGRLTELALIEIFRNYVTQLTANRRSWLRGVQDAHVAKALRLIHTDPARRWTVAQLAREAGVSRSSLADRFARLLGEPPKRYLATWRAQLAKRLLRDSSELTVAEVAARVGYASEAAFVRAFKRVAGSPPAGWRKGAVNALMLATSSSATMKVEPYLAMACAGL